MTFSIGNLRNLNVNIKIDVLTSYKFVIEHISRIFETQSNTPPSAFNRHFGRSFSIFVSLWSSRTDGRGESGTLTATDWTISWSPRWSSWDETIFSSFSSELLANRLATRRWIACWCCILRSETNRRSPEMRKNSNRNTILEEELQLLIGKWTTTVDKFLKKIKKL